MAAAALAAAPAWGGPVEAERIADGVYLFAGEDIGELYVDANSIAIITGAGVVIYDTGARPSRARRLLAGVRKISGKPIRYIVNSEWHPDHYWGNLAFKSANPDAEIVATEATRSFMLATAGSMRTYLGARAKERAEASAADAADTRALKAEAAFIAETAATGIALPTLTYSGDMLLRLGGIEFRFLTMDGDAAGIAALHLPDRRMLLASDVVVYPLPYTPNSTALGAWRESLQRIWALDVDIIVPGHGPALRDKAYVGLLIDLISSVEDQVRAALATGVKTVDLPAAVDLSALKARFVALDAGNEGSFDGVAEAMIRKAAQEARDGAQFLKG